MNSADEIARLRARELVSCHNNEEREKSQCPPFFNEAKYYGLTKIEIVKNGAPKWKRKPEDENEKVPGEDLPLPYSVRERQDRKEKAKCKKSLLAAVHCQRMLTERQSGSEEKTSTEEDNGVKQRFRCIA